MLNLQTTIMPIYTHSIEEFNTFVDKYKAPYELILTKGGNISQKNLRNMPCCKTWKRGNRMEFQYLDADTHIRVLYAIHYDKASDKDEKISYKALNYFKNLMEVIPEDDEQEDTELFTCPENPDSAYYNYANDRYLDVVLDHCYSLDRNNSFPASMMTVYPQTTPWVIDYYKERCEVKQKYKDGLVSKEYWEQFKCYGSIFVGWLNNPKYHRQKAWKRIVSNSNQVVHNLRKQIEAAGNTVLVVNTDAVKFIGHFDFEDNYDLGGFKYEWKDTKMYIKSVKSYAYLDKDKWKFKQAGKTKLDEIKPNRDTWTLEEFINRVDGEIVHIKIKEGKLVEVFE